MSHSSISLLLNPRSKGSEVYLSGFPRSKLFTKLLPKILYSCFPLWNLLIGTKAKIHTVLQKLERLQTSQLSCLLMKRTIDLMCHVVHWKTHHIWTCVIAFSLQKWVPKDFKNTTALIHSKKKNYLEKFCHDVYNGYEVTVFH